MPIDEPYQVTHHRVTCNICGRTFESQGNWAHGAARKCEEECKEKQEQGEKRVFLPPPGRWDSTFKDKRWQWVKIGSPEEECSRVGHDEERRWVSHFDRTTFDPMTGVVTRIPTEIELVKCRRCGVEVHEDMGRHRDAKIEK